jgi:class 3 adenylate cyclase
VRRLIQHVVVYAAVNAFLVATWVLVAGGSPEKLQRVMEQPGESVTIGFWPIYVLLGWGLLLVIHAGFAVSNLLFGDPAGRRRKKMVHQAATGAKDIAKEVVTAIDRAHERRMARDARRDRKREELGLKKPSPPSASAPGRRWVTVMFCDIADSTSHNERLGDEEWHRVLAHIRAVARAALAQRGGSEVGTQGDGMLARFDSPADAVLCGIDIQSELGQARETSDFVPEVRIGVHAGDAVEEDGDLVGRVINLASRVTDQANPGEIMVTEPVADQLVGKLELEDKGLRTLKGVAQPRHLLAVRWSGDASGD